METKDLLEVALAAAREAAAVHGKHLGRVRVDAWSEKGLADFVTHVDREAESVVVQRILAAFPDHSILAEEGTVEAPRGYGPGARVECPPEWLWIVDPLDGTTNFLHGFPVYAASVGVAHRGELMAGAVVCGPSGEEWTATAGGGAYRNGEPISVSRIGQLRQALVATGFPFKALELLPEFLPQLDRVLRHTAGVRRAGSAALDLCRLATGSLDAFWELVLSPWDIAAGVLLVREAGGVVSRLDGSPDVLRGGPLLATNALLHEEFADLIRRISPP